MPKLNRIARRASILDSPKIYSIIIILVLIFLTILALVLIHDILYSRTNVGNDILPYGAEIPKQKGRFIETVASWIGSGAQPLVQNESKEANEMTNASENQSSPSHITPSNETVNHTNLERKSNHIGSAISWGSSESLPAIPKKSSERRSGQKSHGINSHSGSSMPRISSNKTTMASAKSQMQGKHSNKPVDSYDIKNGSVNFSKGLELNGTTVMINIKNEDGVSNIKQITQEELQLDQITNKTLGLDNNTRTEASKEIKTPSNNTTTLVGQNKGQNAPLIEIPKKTEGSHQRVERLARHERSQRHERAKRA